MVGDMKLPGTDILALEKETEGLLSEIVKSGSR
jgi:hypothetical protein